jgi:hypothetical protein
LPAPALFLPRPWYNAQLVEKPYQPALLIRTLRAATTGVFKPCP